MDTSIVDKSYEYKGFLFQRMKKDSLWYAVKENKIMYWSSYRHDIESCIDSFIEKQKDVQ